MFVPRLITALFFVSALLNVQLVGDPTAVPRTGKPPVIFVNGYQSDCASATFAGTFGSAAQVMQSDARTSLFFNNCSVGNRLPLEELGNAFSSFLRSLRYSDGTSVSQVDVVAHSMGGLIVRSYLAGKQVAEGVFNPPAETHIRKIVFLATPHFGTPLGDSTNDVQGRAISFGSAFVVALNTWNQGMDDLRGADALALVGNAGTISLTDWQPSWHDSTVSLMSGSLEFARGDRTRVLPLCHTSGIAALACRGGAAQIANFTSVEHPAARATIAFLNDREEWRTIGETPAQNEVFRTYAGVIVRGLDRQGEPLTIRSGTVQAGGSTRQLGVRNGLTASLEFVPAGPANVSLTTVAGAVETAETLSPGTVRVLSLKPGTRIAAVLPVFGPATPRAVAPGMFVSVYGADLASAEAAVPSPPYPNGLAGTEVLMNGRAVPLQYAGPGQINAVVPDEITGLARLTVSSAAGGHSVNVMVEPAVPSLYPVALDAITGAPISAANPARRSGYLTIYLTGLGATTRGGDGLDHARLQPFVTAGARPCTVQYAGRAPGYSGLDQINCRVAEDADLGEVELSVQSGSRTARISTFVRD